jgi:hypothetical protein
VLAVDALARAVRFERAFIKQDRAAGAVRQDERDRVSGAPSDRLAGQELAMRVEQDGGRLRLIDIDPDVKPVICGCAPPSTIGPASPSSTTRAAAPATL